MLEGNILHDAAAISAISTRGHDAVV